MVYKKSYRGQNWLFPPSIEEMIPEDHICFLVEGFIDSLNFNDFDIKYAGAGRPAYHPRIIMKTLVMGVLDRVRSSRRLARNARENVVYIYLSEKLSPDFRTISDFRKNNPDLVKYAFKHTIALAKNEGLLDLSVLSTDGTKIKANASNRRVLSKEEIEFLSKFIDNELKEWTKQDNLENNFFGEIRGSDQVPEKSKKKMKRAVERYINGLKEKEKINTDNLKKAEKELGEKSLKKVSLTDPECRFMKSKKGRIEFSYNPQITVDKNGIILANDVCQDSHDTDQLKPQVQQTKENVGELPKKVKWNFDNGYFDGENIKFLNKEQIEGYIPLQKNKDNKNDNFLFTYNAEKDEYICPEGKRLTFIGKRLEKLKSKWYRLYRVKNGEPCTCTKSKKKVRQLKRFIDEEERKAMKEKMETPEAKEIYDWRKQTTEPTFGNIKENKGMVSFFTRSLSKVKTEFNIECIGHNLQRINNLRMNKAIIPPT